MSKNNNAEGRSKAVNYFETYLKERGPWNVIKEGLELMNHAEQGFYII